VVSRFQQFSVDFLRKFLFSKRAGALIKIISWLSVTGIGTGVCSLIIVLSVMNGFNTSIRARKFSVEPHLVVYFDRTPLSEIQAHPAVQWIKSQKDVQADVTETQDVILRTTDGFVQGAIAQGLSQETLNYIIENNRKRQKREVEDQKQWSLNAGEVLVGSGVGDIMGLFENDQLVVISPESLLGPKDSLRNLESVRIRNFLHTDVDEIDSQKIFYILGKTLVRLRDTASLERVMEIRLPDPENYHEMRKKIESYGLRVDSWKERNSNLFYSLKLEKFVVGLLLGLSTIIASFSLVTVMFLLITQKRKDIGLLLALGFPPLDLRNVFVRMGVLLAGIGIIGGTLLGLFLSFAIGRYSKGVLPAIYEETNLPSEIHFSQVLVILLIAMVLSYLTTWLSIRKLSQWEPVNALKGI